MTKKKDKVKKTPKTMWMIKNALTKGVQLFHVLRVDEAAQIVHGGLDAELVAAGVSSLSLKLNAEVFEDELSALRAAAAVQSTQKKYAETRLQTLTYQLNATLARIKEIEDGKAKPTS